ncbi:hypothetical protein [Xylophilus sp.]|uniref:hypothetical protein n=1 Tax=Xylophilus sp. TaxID=2653893 RepID=UPI002D7EEF7E|nr:hypothetical protein [Xylophilus sp.]
MRILNGANARNFHIRLSNDQPLQVIASDGGFISTLDPVKRLTISPGERYEVLVDFSKSKDVLDLLTASDDSGGDDQPLMQFIIDDKIEGAIKALPKKLDGPEQPDEKLSVRRRSYFFDERMADNMKLMMGGNSSDLHV